MDQKFTITCGDGKSDENLTQKNMEDVHDHIVANQDKCIKEYKQKEKILEYRKAYWEKNREKLLEYARKRYHERKGL